MAPQIQKQQKQIQRHRDDNIIIMLNGVPVVFVPQRQQQRQKQKKKKYAKEDTFKRLEKQKQQNRNSKTNKPS